MDFLDLSEIVSVIERNCWYDSPDFVGDVTFYIEGRPVGTGVEQREDGRYYVTLASGFTPEQRTTVAFDTVQEAAKLIYALGPVKDYGTHIWDQREEEVV